MDENRYQYFLKNQEYERLLKEAEHARLVNKILRAKRAASPPWTARLLMKIASLLILAGTSLQNRLCAKEMPEASPCENLPRLSFAD